MKKNILSAFIAVLLLSGPAITHGSSNTRNSRQAGAQRALNKKNVQQKKAKKPQKAKPKVKGSKPAGSPRVAKASGRSKATTTKRTTQGRSKSAKSSKNQPKKRTIQPKRAAKTRSAGKSSKPAPKQGSQAGRRAPAARTTQPSRPAATRNVPRGTTTMSGRPAMISAPAVAAMRALPTRTFAPAKPITQPQKPVSTIPAQGTQDSRLLSEQLIKAVRTGNTNDATRLLQTPGVNVNYHAPADPRVTRLHAGGNTPLHEALKKVRERGTDNYRAIAEALIGNPQVDVSAQNDSQATPLHILAGFIPESDPNILLAPKVGIIQNNTEVNRPDLAELARALIQRGADVNAQDMNGRTALHWAVNNGYRELIQLLIHLGTNVNAQDIHGRTPLMKAAQKGYLLIMQQLLNAHADPNIQDFNKGRTALHWIQRMREGAVIKRGNQMTKERALNAIRLLLQEGANPNITDKVTEDNTIARSSLYWAQQKSPWPVNDNRELNLLMQYAGQRANTGNQTGYLAQPAYGF